MCEQVAYGCYMKAEQPGVEPGSFELQVHRSNDYTTRAHNIRLKAAKLEECSPASIDAGKHLCEKEMHTKLS